MTRGSSRLVLVTTLAVFLLIGGAVTAVLIAGPMIRQRITEEAKKRGVEMVFADVNFWWWNASLEGVRFRLIGVPGIEGTAKHIDVALSNFEPRQIEATDVVVAVNGSAADLALAIPEWTKNHPGAYQVPLSAHGVSLGWRASPSEPPWLTSDGGAMTASATGATFTAPKATMSGVDLGSIAAAWMVADSSVTMSFGAADPKAAPVQATVRYAATPPLASITLAPTELSRLAGPMGIPLPAPGVIASGRVDLTFTQGLDRGPVMGSLESRLDGWVPPHPVELDGFLFGTTTTFTSKLDVSADRFKVQLTDSRVKAGGFELTGGGRIDRGADYAVVTMNLGGNLSCAQIAASAAAAHVGTFLSEIVGQASRKVLDGSVAVKVKIAADSRHLDAARVEPTIGVGCGLAPLRSIDPKLVQKVKGNLQDLANALPPLPQLPPLPTFGTLPDLLPKATATAAP